MKHTNTNNSSGTTSRSSNDAGVMNPLFTSLAAMISRIASQVQVLLAIELETMVKPRFGKTSQSMSQLLTSTSTFKTLWAWDHKGWAGCLL